MTDFTDLERRLGGALDRIRAAIAAETAARRAAEAQLAEHRAEPPPDPEASDAYRALAARAGEAEADLDEARGRISAMEADLSATRSEAERLRAELEQAAARTAGMPDPADGMAAAAAEARATEAEAALDEANRRLAATEADLAAARDDAERLRAEAAGLREGLDEGRQTDAGMIADAVADTGPVTATEAGDRDDLVRRIDDLSGERDAAHAEAADLRARLAAIEGEGRLGTVRAQSIAEALQARVTELESTVAALQGVNAQLRQNNTALRDAHEAALPDAGLVNAGLKSELEALRAAREADRAEIDGVLAALRPLLDKENAHA